LPGRHGAQEQALFERRTRFDQETVRILGVAFEQVCIGLRTGDCADDVKQAIANKIIELALFAASCSSSCANRSQVCVISIRVARSMSPLFSRRQGARNL